MTTMTGTRRRRVVRIAVAAAAAVAVVVAVVLIAQWLRTMPWARDFISEYPGTSSHPQRAHIGLPGWIGWQHFLNAFFLLLIVRTGLQIRYGGRAPAHWTRAQGWPIRTRRAPRTISLTLWFHLALDALWVVNGLIFVLLAFLTGHWVRIVPTDWDIIPNAVSVGLQYASLEWPVENGWVHYNALQVIAYFITVFIAAPVALVTGLRMSPVWPAGPDALANRLYPAGIARFLHFGVMLWFVGFTVVHVTLVLATGALRNLNHMYAARDDAGWLGLGIFAVSAAVMAGAWAAARPAVLRAIASTMGTVSR